MYGLEANRIDDAGFFGEHPGAVSTIGQNTYQTPFAPTLKGANMKRTNGLNGRSVVQKRRNYSSSGDVKNANQDWLAAELAKMPVAEVISYTGMTEKAVQNIRRKKSKLSFDNLTEILRAKPEFRAAYFYHCGGMLEGSPEKVAALTRAFNAIMQSERETP